ncbi:HAMP domain-containing sensor histidine kinase [Brotaphodocola sp.]|uniref:HAMP domain-containing sensor histidine kinase n=1 Tax=Brotaphodocola sp. TaxID=3073577 RepID=UPI003D7C9511
MTIQDRLKRSNMIMLIVPVCIAGILLILGFGSALVLLQKIYLPRIGLTLRDLHEMGEQIEDMFSGLKFFAVLYLGIVVCTLLATVGFINLYLTRSLFSHIQLPLDTLLEGVKRIQNGDLETPIFYPNEDEFRSVCDAVNEMSSRLRDSLARQQKQEQKKQELIAGMSHDLKSPLTTIRAYTEALLDGIATDESTRQKYLETIYAREGELEALIHRLFELTKLGADEYPVHLEKLQFPEMIRELISTCKPEALSVTFSDDPPPVVCTVLADTDLLQRIFQNVFDNSLKYGADRAVVSSTVISSTMISSTVTLTEQKQTENKNQGEKLLMISITDNGPGVPNQQLSNLFEPFYRGSSSRSTAGSGLGLSIVKKSMEQMGGDVSAQNSSDGGLCITLTFPIIQS